MAIGPQGGDEPARGVTGQDDLGLPALVGADGGQGQAQVLVVLGQRGAPAQHLALAPGAAVAAQVQGVEGATQAGDLAGQVGLEEVVVPAVQVEVDEGGGGGGARQRTGVEGWQVSHQGGDGAVVLVVGQQLQGAGLEARAQEVRPPGVCRCVLGRCVHLPMIPPRAGERRRMPRLSTRGADGRSTNSVVVSTAGSVQRLHFCDRNGKSIGGGDAVKGTAGSVGGSERCTVGNGHGEWCGSS